MSTADPDSEPASGQIPAAPLARFEDIGLDGDDRRRPGVSFALAAGGFQVVVGPRGCGKSALLRIAALRERPPRGVYWFDGRDTRALARGEAARLRRRIGLVAAEAPPLAHLSVHDNAALGRRLAGEGPAAYAAPIEELLRWVGLWSAREAPADQLTIGQGRRLCLAMALAQGPDLLVVDEPTRGLAGGEAEDMLRLIAQAHAGGTSVLMATADADLAAASGAPVLRLNR